MQYGRPNATQTAERGEASERGALSGRASEVLAGQQAEKGLPHFKTKMVRMLYLLDWLPLQPSSESSAQTRRPSSRKDTENRDPDVLFAIHRKDSILTDVIFPLFVSMLRPRLHDPHSIPAFVETDALVRENYARLRRSREKNSGCWTKGP